MLPRPIDDSEVVERCIYALINEGARILEEGIALRASDIDVVYLTGYGFPPTRGGPLFYADTIGLQTIIAAMRRFAANPRPRRLWQTRHIRRPNRPIDSHAMAIAARCGADRAPARFLSRAS